MAPSPRQDLTATEYSGQVDLPSLLSLTLPDLEALQQETYRCPGMPASPQSDPQSPSLIPSPSSPQSDPQSPSLTPSPPD